VLIISTFVGSVLFAIAIITVSWFAYWITTVVWIIFYEVFVTADIISLFLPTISSLYIFWTNPIIIWVSLIILTSSVFTIYVPVTESICIVVELYFTKVTLIWLLLIYWSVTQLIIVNYCVSGFLIAVTVD
jgi:hypothetical protein